MALLRNKKAVEALPLRYIIIALVAALVVGIALQFTGTLRGGIQNTADTLNDTLSERTMCELDNDAPVIMSASGHCTGDRNVTISADITDECGTSEAWAYIKESASDSGDEVVLRTSDSDRKDATWTGGYNADSDYPSTITVYIYAKDKATGANTISSQNDAYNLTLSC